MIFYLALKMPAMAASIENQIDLIAKEAATLKLGFGHYILGMKLSEAQQEQARQHPMDKSLEGTYKFKDGEIFIVATAEDDIVLGVYKEYPEITMDEIKNIVGTMMLEHGEPTLSAHDKMIYWIFDENGKIERDTFAKSKDSESLESLATVKFSSSERIGSVPEKESEPISAYLMITSDPLSKLFLAKEKQ